jgi:hypothetical protein
VSRINCLIGHFNFPRYVQATQLFRVRLNCDRFHGVCDSYSYCPCAPRLTGQRMCMVTRRPMEPCIIGTNLRLDAMNHPSTSTSYIEIYIYIEMRHEPCLTLQFFYYVHMVRHYVMDQEVEIHLDLILVAGIGIGTDWSSGVQFPSRTTDFLHSIQVWGLCIGTGNSNLGRKAAGA